MRVCLHPQPKPPERLQSGVDAVVHQMHRHLPAAGVELVRAREAADLLAVHICPPQGEPVDVLHCHGLYPTGQQKLPAWCWESNARIIAAARSARRVTVPSPWVAELFTRDMGLLPTVVPHGLDLAAWPAVAREPRGVVVWNKNRTGDVCSPAPLDELAKACPDFRFLTTFGTAAPHVQVTGVLPHAAMRKLLYEEAGIYYAPTKETFGIGILEAFAAGLPVLAWRHGHAPYLVRHGHNGYLVEPHDTAGAREGLRYILDHYAALSNAARETAIAYDWGAIAERYAMLYHDVLAGAATAREGLVSVVIPCHDYARFLPQAVESVRAQTYPHWECLIVDDGSTDDSAAVAGDLAGDDPRIRVLLQPNRGVAYARNRGAREARGEYLCFLDADDWLHPEALERLVPALAADRGVGLAYGRLALADAAGASTGKPSEWPGAYDLAAQLAGRNQVPACNVLRREALRRAGGFRQRTAPCEDAELWTRLPLLGYRVVQATEAVTYTYRMHDASASAAVRGRKEPDWRAWLPALHGGKMPFASLVAPPSGLSHPVVDYDRPLVSFVIPCGDAHRDLLGDALESVAGQTDGRWEVIVVDDTAAGDLAEHGALPYREQYPWVRWEGALRRGNVSASRNQGAREARGHYLCFLDADDYLLRDFLAATWRVLQECHGDGALCYTDWIASPQGEAHKAANWHLPRLLEGALFAVTFVHPKSAWERVGGFDEGLTNWEDWDYTIKLGLEGYKGIRVPQPLFVYRYHTGRRREEALANQERLLAEIRSRYVGKAPKPRRG